MKLVDFASRYAIRIGASDNYAYQLAVLTRRFGWTVADLTRDKIDAYLTQALSNLSAATVQNHRRMLCTLRKAALQDGLVDDCTDKIRRVKVNMPLPRAWSHAEIERLLNAAGNMKRGSGRCPWKVLMPAYILVAYSSGLRLGDMMSIRHDSLRGNRLALVMGKTRRPHVCVLDDAAVAAIATLPDRGPEIFGSLVSRCVFLRAFRRLVKRAGLKGTSKFLRRSSCTYAVLAGKDPTGHLGHATAGLAQKHYVDPVLIAECKTAIPSISPPRSSARVPDEPPRTAGPDTGDTAAADLAAWI
jgi:integrase